MRPFITIAALSTFGLGLISAVGLSGCDKPEMYCLSADGDYAANFYKTQGDDNCLPPHGRINLDYYLGVTDMRPDPTKATMGFTLKSKRKAIDNAVAQIEAIKAYKDAECQDKDTSVGETIPQDTFVNADFVSVGTWSALKPDAQENCSVVSFSQASLNIPAMPAVPACLDADGKEALAAKPALPAVNTVYSANDVVLKVNPAFQGLYARGSFQYQGLNDAGESCSATFEFEAINPATKCEVTADCAAAQAASKTLITSPLVCFGATPDKPDDKDGYCVLAPN